MQHDLASEIVRLNKQMTEVIVRVGNGSRSPTSVRRELQNIIEGRIALTYWDPPVWWETLEAQLATVGRLWPDIDLPVIPAELAPRNGEVPLLNINRPFYDLWDSVPTSPSLVPRKTALYDIESGGLELVHAAPKYQADAVWVYFNPEYTIGHAPRSLWMRPDIASSEVMSALIQFPRWPLSWGLSSYPRASGFVYTGDDGRQYVPTFDYIHSSLTLGLADAADENDKWSSPVVRLLG